MLSTGVNYSRAQNREPTTDLAAREPISESTKPLRRQLWMDSRVIGSPDPTPPFQLHRVFPDLAFDKPLFIIKDPATERLLVIEVNGKIWEVTPDTTTTSQLFFDVGRETYSLCFHPNYADNHYLFIFSNGKFDGKSQNRISRYTIQNESPHRPDPSSEMVILQYESAGHNGHHVLFGPDGLLYISSGDGTVGMDPELDGQDVSNLRSAILRVDVDRPQGGQAYSIPADNPFRSRANTRPEIWAFGLRNPYRMAFDPTNDKLWVADIGQDAWEMIYLIERGMNCGWSIMEGSHPLALDRARGPAAISAPIIEHPHSEMRSITGGYFYRGQQFPELRDAFLYGDYDTGKVWAAKYDYVQQKVAWQRELADSTIRVLSIGEDKDGEPLIVDFAEGGLYELKRIPPEKAGPPFPQRLSETGIFDDVPAHRVKTGLIPYRVNAALWSDGTIKERFLGLPGDTQMEFTNPDDWRAWRFPSGTVLVKTFSLDAELGNPATRRRIETRLLTLQVGPVGGEWAGYTYRWNDQQTDAELVAKPGEDIQFTVADLSTNKGQREVKWHFPSRAECMMCHTREARYVLGLTTLQLNCDYEYEGTRDNQIRTFERLGLFKKRPTKSPEQLSRMVDPYDISQPLEQRVRSYLHANCAHCHVTNGGGNSELVIDYLTPLKKTQIMDVVPQHKGFSLADSRLIAPGSPERSLIWHRMKVRGRGQMPPLASAVTDQAAVELFSQWIRSLPASSDARSCSER